MDPILIGSGSDQSSCFANGQSVWEIFWNDVGASLEDDVNRLRLRHCRVVRTPFIYLPRTQPAAPIPLRIPVSADPRHFDAFAAPEWRSFESAITATSTSVSTILTKVRGPGCSD
jgi:hypothetical protein